MRKLACVAVVLSIGALALAQGYDAMGFEPDTFTLGPLDGQDGWVGAAELGGTPPMVVGAPDPVIGTQAVRLATNGAQGDKSIMEHVFLPGDLLAAGYTNLVVSFDIYRPTIDTDQNLWFWLFDAGTPTYGLQWDIGGTLPFGFGNASAPTIAGAYATLMMEWDFVDMMAYSWYNGAVVDSGVAITDITTLTGWHIELAHDADTNDIADQAFIDNFVAIATPEPSTLMLLALGLLLRRR